MKSTDRAMPIRWPPFTIKADHCPNCGTPYLTGCRCWDEKKAVLTFEIQMSDGRSLLTTPFHHPVYDKGLDYANYCGDCKLLLLPTDMVWEVRDISTKVCYPIHWPRCPKP